MESHHINDYLEQRIKNLALKQKNLVSRARNYVSDEKFVYKPSSMYGTPDIEERVMFNQERNQNMKKYANQAYLNDAVKAVNNGTLIVQDEDTRTTMQKLNDEQFLKDNAYKYANDLLKDTREASEFIEKLQSLSPDAMILFVQHFATIKQQLNNVKLLTSDFLIDYVEKFMIKIRDTALVENPLSYQQFSDSMANYKVPGKKQLKELRGILTELQTLKPDQITDLIQRVDAVTTIAAQTQQDQLNITSTLPTKSDIDQLHKEALEIRNKIDAAKFMDDAIQIMESVTASEIKKVLDHVDKKIVEMHQEIDTKYNAPTLETLAEFEEKLDKFITNDRYDKQELLLKIEALVTTVAQLQQPTFQSSTPLPSQEDIQALLQTTDEEEFITGAKELLAPVTSETNTELIAESGQPLEEEQQQTKTMHIGRKIEEMSKNIKLKTLKDYLKGNKYDPDALIEMRQKNNISVYNTIQVIQDILNSTDINEIKKSYSLLMRHLGFAAQNRAPTTIMAVIQSPDVTERLASLGITDEEFQKYETVMHVDDPAYTEI